MIIDLDPLSTAQSTTAAFENDHEAPASRYRSHPVPSRLSPSFVARESAAERTYGYLWSPGLLDRLSAPLTRHHD